MSSRAWRILALTLVLTCNASCDKATEPAVLATLTVSLSATTIQMGQTATAIATDTDQNGRSIPTSAVIWSSSSPAVATIASDGSITSLAPGLTTITASTRSKAGQANLTVIPSPVASVTIVPATPSIVVGGTQQLTATMVDANNAVLTGRAVVWSSSDAAKASVSATGLVTAVAVGSATITATSEGKLSTATVTVLPVPVATVSVSPATASIIVGATNQLNPVTRDVNGNILAGRVVTWSSSDAAKASVSATGLVSAVAVGSATITATSEGKSGTAVITIPIGAVLGFPIETLNGAYPPLVRIIAEGRNWTDSADFGSRTAQLQTHARLGDTIAVTVDPIGARSSFFPQYFAVAVTASGYVKILGPVFANNTGMSVLLLPTMWRVERGTFAGQEVAISLNLALESPPGSPSPSYYNNFGCCLGIIGSWLPSRFPIPTFFDRDTSTVPITGADSVALWSVIEDLERVFGRDMFVPARQQDWPDMRTPWGTCCMENGMHVWLDTTLSRYGIAGVAGGQTGSHYFWRTLGTERAGFWARAGSQDFQMGVGTKGLVIGDQVPGYFGYGHARFANSAMLGNRYVVQHEFMHALGFGHGCSLPSIQSYPACGATYSATLTAYDVAYAEIIWATLRRERELKTTVGLATSWFGERVRRLGLPPVPSPAANAAESSAQPGRRSDYDLTRVTRP